MRALIYAVSGNWQEIDPIFLCKYYHNLSRVPRRHIDTHILEKVKAGCNDWELREIYHSVFRPDPLSHNFAVTVPASFNKRRRIDYRFRFKYTLG